MYLQRQIQKESAENSTVIMCMLVLTLGHLYHRDGFDEVSAKKWGHRKQHVYMYNQVSMEQKNDSDMGTYMVPMYMVPMYMSV